MVRELAGYGFVLYGLLRCFLDCREPCYAHSWLASSYLACLRTAHIVVVVVCSCLYLVEFVRAHGATLDLTDFTARHHGANLDLLVPDHRFC